MNQRAAIAGLSVANRTFTVLALALRLAARG